MLLEIKLLVCKLKKQSWADPKLFCVELASVEKCPLQTPGKREVSGSSSQPLPSSEFEVFIFSGHVFDNVFMFLERVVVFMFLFFLTDLCRIFEVEKTKWCRRLTHIRSKETRNWGICEKGMLCELVGYHYLFWSISTQLPNNC